MNILLTGSSGFLGKIIKYQTDQYLTTITLSRSSSSNITADITKSIPALPSVDIVVHAAGKAHVVPRSEHEEKQFLEVNHKGTLNLLKKLNGGSLPNTFVFISTVAVYGKEVGKLITEDFALKGKTPYAVSKIKAEEAVRKWGKSKGVNTVILRLPLVAGPNPPGNLQSMIKAINKGYYFRIGKGSNRKSIVLAEDIGRLVPQLVAKNGTYNLTDGHHPTISELDSYLADKLSSRVKVLPEWLVRKVSMVGDFMPQFPINTDKFKKLTNTLTFSDKKARKELNWAPHKVIGNFRLRSQ